jgi:hypothetical protein
MDNPNPQNITWIQLFAKRHPIDLNPNRKVATKGGSMPGILQTRKA